MNKNIQGKILELLGNVPGLNITDEVMLDPSKLKY